MAVSHHSRTPRFSNVISTAISPGNAVLQFQRDRPLVSILTPAYNESSIMESHLTILCDHLKTIESRYAWEIVVVNDGSRDNTGELADSFADRHEGVKVVHHDFPGIA